MSDLGKLEEERDAWKKQSIAVQEMLAQVLLSVGEPIVVPKEQELPEGVAIAVDWNQEDESFVFYLAKDEDPVTEGA